MDEYMSRRVPSHLVHAVLLSRVEPVQMTVKSSLHVKHQFSKQNYLCSLLPRRPERQWWVKKVRRIVFIRRLQHLKCCDGVLGFLLIFVLTARAVVILLKPP